MNDYKLKLEVFKLTLKETDKIDDPNFRNLFNLKFLDREEEIDDAELLGRYNKFLSEELDNKGEYHQINRKSKRAFSLSNAPTLNSKENYVYGFVKGGFKGDNKTSSSIKDKDNSESLDNKVINNEHFFLLYTPLNSNIGFLIFQSYPQESIRLEFVNFLSKNIFRHRGSYNKIEAEAYLTKSIKDEFKNGATVSRMTFTDRVLKDVISEKKSFANEPDQYRIKVVIEPIGENKLSYNNFDRFSFFEKIKNKKVFNKTLGSYAKKKGQLSKNGDKTAFTIGGTEDILPIVRLGSGYLDDKEIPNFESIKKYCFKLLEEVKDEFYEQNKPIALV